MWIFFVFVFHWNPAVGIDCLEKEFKCKDGYLCISKKWVCDEIRDCYDASDENDCPTPSTTLATPPIVLVQQTQLSSHVTDTSTITTTKEATTSTTRATTNMMMTMIMSKPSTTTAPTLIASVVTTATTTTTTTTAAMPSTTTETTTSKDATRTEITITIPTTITPTIASSATTAETTTSTPTTASAAHNIRATTNTTTITTSSPTTTAAPIAAATTSLPMPTTTSADDVVISIPTPSTTTTRASTTTTTTTTSITSSDTTSSDMLSTFLPPKSPGLTMTLCSLRNVTRCRSGMQCIPRNYLCDGIRDCSDGSDEESCVCTGSNDVPCGPGNCQKSSLLCRGLSSCYKQKNREYCSNATSTVPRQASETPPFTQRVCSPVNEFTCSNGNCISRWWICDGVDDCFDYSDELNCPSVGGKCPKGQVTCFNSSTCIGSWQVCNRYDDCPGGSDEVNCQYGPIIDPVIHFTATYLYWIVRRVCNDDEFKCPDDSNNGCLPLSWRCDGIVDCRNGEDERNCQPFKAKTCEETKGVREVFQCFNSTINPPYSSFCVNPSFRCNWVADCPDGSDEVGCYCDDQRKLKMRCTSFQCISSTRWCDGVRDCMDGSDERFCHEVECLGNSFKCKVLGKCLPMEYKCNGVVECPDGSDEVDCPCSPELGFRCEERGKCLEFGRFCNGIRDCQNGSDEPADCRLKCAPNTFQCLTSGSCVHPTAICDTIVDCDDGSDETSCNVKEI